MPDPSSSRNPITDGAPNLESDELFMHVYAELKELAAAKLRREKAGHTLQPTALVHEVFMRLYSSKQPQQWESRAHFLGAAANSMRRILIENARRKQSLKRGGDRERIDVELDDVKMEMDDEQLIRLDEALARLAEEDPIKAKLIELRFFGGLSVEEACQLLDISRATAHRYWKYAQAWLFLQVTEDA